MTDERPNIQSVLRQLKDFQRSTVDYVFRRMYLDADHTRRFLVADEVGLGKTLVARGIIANTIEHLWDRGRRIDVVYVCSNGDIARQNIKRLNVTGRSDFALASRITLLPVTAGQMDRGRLNFVSFTPGTSFEQSRSAGRKEERYLLYWLLEEPWSLNFNKATRVLQGGVTDTGRFRSDVERYWHNNNNDIDEEIAAAFADTVAGENDLRLWYEELAERMPRANASVPPELNADRNRFIGEVRRVLARTCLRWLEPDLIILDEFQRFKHLLGGDDEDSSEAAELARHLFDYEDDSGDPALAARVLLLSATPYKMFTLAREAEEDDHYEDFLSTLRFLVNDEEEATARLGAAIHDYREGLYRLPDRGHERMLRAKSNLEGTLGRVMVRTERLGLKADRNGMLREVPSSGMALQSADVRQYLVTQRIAEGLEQEDVLEYCKSAPYLLNFMDDYELKRRLRTLVESRESNREVARAIQDADGALLNGDRLERFKRLDPSNARLRSLHADTIGREAWKLLWIPPSLPYYAGGGAYAEPDLQSFTKRLVFSSWRVVPKAVASLLSYDAERSMVHDYRRRSGVRGRIRNTPERRKKRTPLLRFTFSKGRPVGMAVLGLVYPCRTLADLFDPLGARAEPNQPLVDPRDVLLEVEQRLNPIVQRIVDRHGHRSGASDERWYWAAPLLLDREHHPEVTSAWFEQPDLAEHWQFDVEDEHRAARGWSRHVDIARTLYEELEPPLGPPPDDLVDVLARQAIAGPSVAGLRALDRIVAPESNEDRVQVRNAAGSLGYAFVHLFNLPEVIYLLRTRGDETPYWKLVLDYCVDGNLQAVLDEYAHILRESLGLIDRPPSEVAEEIAKAIGRALTLRTSNARVDLISANRVRVLDFEPVRMRHRFAVRFGTQESDESGEVTTADHVRSAFNSPFWPFVLVSTSVGQEGLDFHPYCHAVVHWNLPSNPVDLEQREGRVHRYKGHALRRNIADRFADAVTGPPRDPWDAMFEAAKRSRPPEETDLFPFWVSPEGPAKIERHIPSIAHSREAVRSRDLLRSLVLYRMVFGQNRQEDLVAYLRENVDEQCIEDIVEQCRIDLSPPTNGPPSTDPPEVVSEESPSVREQPPETDRARGCLLGLAIGDALGAAVEFQSPGTFDPVTSYRAGGPHRLNAGEWTDDTSMALALADSIARVEWSLDDQAERYVDWWRNGRYSVNGLCFDIGNTTKWALSEFESKGDARMSGSTSERASGNGSIMRLAPVPIRYSHHFPSRIEDLARFAAESSQPTHASEQCLSACRYLSLVLAGLIRGVHRDEVLSPSWEPLARLREIAPLHPEVDAVAAGSFRELAPPQIQGSGYVVKSLEAALWAFHDADGFEQAVLRAVNLGDDADTTGAVCGQLAGAYWGGSGIPGPLVDGLAKRELIEDALDGLLHRPLADHPESEPARPDAGPDAGPVVSNKPAFDEGGETESHDVDVAETSGFSALDRVIRDPPTTSSYWVVPGKLLAGAYPGAADSSEHWKKLGALLEGGVRAFVNLMEQGETNHEGRPFRPYEELVRSMEPDCHCARFPIPDLGVPSPEEMATILEAIDERLTAGRAVYVHCWGGVGRTGTVIACWMLRHGHATIENVLDELAVLRVADSERGHRDSPETDAQREFIVQWAERASDVPDSGGPRHWADDPYWTEALDRLDSIREQPRGELVIDLADLDELVWDERSPAYRLMEAMHSVHELEGWDGYRGAPRVLTALLIRLAEASARRKSGSERGQTVRHERTEALKATARECGVYDVFEALRSELAKHFDSFDVTKSTITFYGKIPSVKSGAAILALVPRESNPEDGLLVRFILTRVCDYTGMDAETIIEALPIGFTPGKLWSETYHIGHVESLEAFEPFVRLLARAR